MSFDLSSRSQPTKLLYINFNGSHKGRATLCQNVAFCFAWLTASLCSWNVFPSSLNKFSLCLRVLTGLLAPTLVQFEQEIDREIENEHKQQQQSSQDHRSNNLDSSNQDKSNTSNGRPYPDHRRLVEPSPFPSMLLSSHQTSNPMMMDDLEPHQQIINNDLESLHEKVSTLLVVRIYAHSVSRLFVQVVKLLSRCTCPVQFYLEHLSEGKYRIGDTRTLIFVRVSVKDLAQNPGLCWCIGVALIVTLG